MNSKAIIDSIFHLKVPKRLREPSTTARLIWDAYDRSSRQQLLQELNLGQHDALDIIYVEREFRYLPYWLQLKIDTHVTQGESIFHLKPRPSPAEVWRKVSWGDKYNLLVSSTLIKPIVLNPSDRKMPSFDSLPKSAQIAIEKRMREQGMLESIFHLKPTGQVFLDVDTEEGYYISVRSDGMVFPPAALERYEGQTIPGFWTGTTGQNMISLKAAFKDPSRVVRRWIFGFQITKARLKTYYNR